MNRNYLPAIVFGILCLVWGSTWIFIKIGLQDAPPLLSAGMRFLVAAILLYPFVRLRGLSIPRDWKTLSVMVYTGLFAVSASYGLVYWGEQYISAGLTSVLFSAFPIFVILFSHFVIADDRLSVMKLLGAIIGFTGVAIIFADSLKFQDARTVLGTAGVVLGAVCAAVSNVVIKRNFKSLHPVVLTLVHMMCGSLALLAAGLVFENLNEFNITMSSVGSVLYLAVMGSCVAFICYYWLISQVRVTTASLVVFVIPIVALFLDWLVLDETLHWRVLAGSGLVISGVGIASR